jgi:hypothetical protein
LDATKERVFENIGLDQMTLVQKSSEVNHRSTVEMLHVNSLNTLPISLTMSMVLGELGDIGQSVSIAEQGFTWVHI